MWTQIIAAYARIRHNGARRDGARRLVMTNGESDKMHLPSSVGSHQTRARSLRDNHTGPNRTFAL